MMIKPVQAPAGEAVLLEAVKALTATLTPAAIKKELEARNTFRKKVNKDIDAANAELNAREAAMLAGAQQLVSDAEVKAAGLLADAEGLIALERDVFEAEKADAKAAIETERRTLRARAAKATARENAVSEGEQALEDQKDDLIAAQAAADQKMADAQEIMDAAAARRQRIMAAASE